MSLKSIWIKQTNIYFFKKGDIQREKIVPTFMLFFVIYFIFLLTFSQ